MYSFVLKNKHVFISYFKVWVFIRVLLFLLISLVYKNYVECLGTTFYDYCTLLYDNEYYYNIAKNGCYYNDSVLVFFPFLVFIIKIFGLYGTIIINNILSLVVSYLLFYYCDICCDIDCAKEVGFLFLVSPLQIYSMTLYTEFFLLFFGILGFILYHNKKNSVVTGIVLGLCCMCRLFGLTFIGTLIIVEFINFIKKKQITRYFLQVSFISVFLGFLFPIYVSFSTKNLFGLVYLEEKFWCRIKINIINFIPKVLKLLNSVVSEFILLYKVEFIVIFIIYLISIVIIFKYILLYNRTYTSYICVFIHFVLSLILSCSTLITYTSVSPLGGIGRYFYSIFTLYILFLVLICTNKKLINYIYLLEIVWLIYIGFYFYRGIYFF